MLKKRSFDLCEVCTEKKKRPPPLELFGAESRQVALFHSLMILDLCLGILPFLSAKEVMKFQVRLRAQHGTRGSRSTT